MKSLKLLNKKYLSIILFSLLFGFSTQPQEPADIWNTDLNEVKEEKDISQNLKKNGIPKNSVYEMQSEKNTQSNVEEDQTLNLQETKLIGLYDPAENGLDINMWSNSNGNEILNIFKRINKINLSKDAAEILDILLLTNAYQPEINISKKQFQKIKSDWLIKSSNFQLIEEYLLKNKIINENPELTKYLVDDFLSNSNVKRACGIFSKIDENINDEYLSKFHIYCLINDNKKNEAQLLLDLKKELGFSNKFYEDKISYLMGYSNKPEKTISEKTILDFHLSHKTNPKFKFIPTDNTSKQIWKYLSTSNLLDNLQEIDLEDINRIKTIEKAVHDKNYAEKELFDLYKRFQFNINQLLNIRESSKVLSSIETRALIYQGILITTEIEYKLQLLNALKNSFKNDDLDNAFNQELKKFLIEINPELVPSKYTKFYNRYVNNEKKELASIKINNKVLHQSKLINYFREEVPIKNITKDLNDLIKKVKKNKKYFFSKKDIILVEALKSDGIEVLDRYKSLYEINDSEIPSDIKISVDKADLAGAMLRIVEVIGQDELKDMDVDTMYFIIDTLNKLDVDPIRNKLILKILPLKV